MLALSTIVAVRIQFMPLAEGRVVDGDPAEVEAELLDKPDEMESYLPYLLPTESLDSLGRDAKPRSANSARWSFFVVHHQHAMVLQLHGRRISAANRVNLDGSSPTLGIVAADVQSGCRLTMCEQDFAG
jgi:hypothetical protein